MYSKAQNGVSVQANLTFKDGCRSVRLKMACLCKRILPLMVATQVRFSDGRSERAAHGGLRESVRAVQPGRAVHADRHAAGSQHGRRARRLGRQLSPRRLHFPLHRRQFHQRAIYGPGASGARGAHSPHDGNGCFHQTAAISLIMHRFEMIELN